MQVNPASTVHVAEHPSKATEFPSSHASPVSYIMFPQMGLHDPPQFR